MKTKTIILMEVVVVVVTMGRVVVGKGGDGIRVMGSRL
jgi:hypothetical protein